MTEENTTNSPTKGCPACFTKLAPLFRLAEFKIRIAQALTPLALLSARITLAYVFYKSGTLKLPAGFLGIGKGNWDSTLLLFEYEHPVPGLSPQLAAYLGTSVEIIAPIMLVLGLGTRIGAFALLFMTAIIQFTYQSSIDHAYWASLSFILICSGGGLLSADHLIRLQANKCPKYNASK